MSLAIIAAAPFSAAETAISGVVVAVEPTSGSMILRRDGSGELITVNLVKGHLDGAITPGSHVMAGGEFRSGTKAIFEARKVKPRKTKSFGFDPTGVRKRLYKNSFLE